MSPLASSSWPTRMIPIRPRWPRSMRTIAEFPERTSSLCRCRRRKRSHGMSLRRTSVNPCGAGSSPIIGRRARSDQRRRSLTSADIACRTWSCVAACRCVLRTIPRECPPRTPRGIRRGRRSTRPRWIRNSPCSRFARFRAGGNGPAANPFFERAQPSADVLHTYLRVARLDGPDRAACEHLILSALAGEQRGVAGRAYVDEGGPHPMADRWLELAAAALRARDFDVTVNGPGGMFAETDRFDAPIFISAGIPPISMVRCGCPAFSSRRAPSRCISTVSRQKRCIRTRRAGVVRWWRGELRQPSAMFSNRISS